MCSKKHKCNMETTNTSNFASFSEVGGLAEQITMLKELVIFPFIYSEVYDKFKVRPPRGVLFYGPPGTGKTLIAGALAKECGKAINKNVSFYSRRGADILDKWVGESEERLRTLFTEAAENHPSIIFFDEIDGLAPVRSSRHDQVHASIVATLLALMDGLDKMEGVIVIGATNRIDTIDPALRRPGRFDKELYFPLPAYKARLEILEVHIKSWAKKPSSDFLSYLADVTVGYCGSDLQALCSEAVMACLRRNYPEIHENINNKAKIKFKNFNVEEIDFLDAKKFIVPHCTRDASPLRRLSLIIKPLLQNQLDEILSLIKATVPHFLDATFRYQTGAYRYCGRLLIKGTPNQGHNTHLMPAVLHALEHLPYFVLDIQNLYKTSHRTADEICVQKLSQARKNLPSIVLAYRLNEWWNIIDESTKAILMSLLDDLHAGLPLFVLGTSTTELPACLSKFFNKQTSIIYTMRNPTEEEISNFLKPIFNDFAYNKCREIKPVINKSKSCTVNNELKKSKEIGTALKKKIMVDSSTRHDGVKKLITKHNSKHSNLSKKSSMTTRSRYKAINNEIESKRKKIDEITDFTEDDRYSQEHFKTYFVNYNYRQDSKSERLGTFTDRLYSTCQRSYSDEQNSEINKHMLSRKCHNLNYEFKGSPLEKLSHLFRRALTVTTLNMDIGNLEILYDMLTVCVKRENQTVDVMLQNIADILDSVEKGNI